MTVFDEFPTIKVISVDKLVLHEWHDDQRSKPLIDALKASGVLRNPPIVAPFQDGTGRYMVLDGANRTTAFSHMGFPHVLAQVAEPDSPALQLNTWNHVMWDMPTEKFFTKLEAIPNLHFEVVEDEREHRRKLRNHSILVWVQTPDGKVHTASSEKSNLFERTKMLNNIANAYKNDCCLDRTRVSSIDSLREMYENLTALVVYPPYRIQEVLELCGAGQLLPAGITRFSVAPRALRINYPLDELGADSSLDEKNEKLNQWLQERLARKGIRFYAEPTVLFDE